MKTLTEEDLRQFIKRFNDTTITEEDDRKAYYRYMESLPDLVKIEKERKQLNG